MATELAMYSSPSSVTSESDREHQRIRLVGSRALNQSTKKLDSITDASAIAPAQVEDPQSQPPAFSSNNDESEPEAVAGLGRHSNTPTSNVGQQGYLFARVAATKSGQDAQIRLEIRRRETQAQETANALSRSVDPLSPSYDNDANPYAEDPDHATLLKIKNFLSDSDDHFTLDFDRKLAEISDFLVSLRRTKDRYDKKLLDEVYLMLEIHQHRLEEQKHPEVAQISYHNLPRQSHRFYSEKLRGGFKSPRDRPKWKTQPPFTFNLPENYPAVLQRMMKDDSLAPNSLIMNEVDTYVRSEPWDRAEFEGLIRDVDPMYQSAMLRGRQRRVLEGALNTHANASEQNHLGQLCQRTVQSPADPLPAAVEPRLAPIPDAESSLALPYPFRRVDKFIRFRSDRQVLLKISAEQTRMSDSLGPQVRGFSQPEWTELAMHGRLKKAVRRFMEILRPFYLDLSKDKQHGPEVSKILERSAGAKGYPSRHSLIDFIIDNATSCLYWPVQVTFTFLHAFLSHRKPSIIPLKALTALEVKSLQDFLSADDTKPDATIISFAQRLINELRAFLIQDSIMADPSIIRRLGSFERKQLDDICEDLQRIDLYRDTRFQTLADIGRHDAAEPSDKDQRTNFLEQVMQEHNACNVHQAIDASRMWDFTNNFEENRANTVWFSQSRRAGSRPTKLLEKDSLFDIEARPDAEKQKPGIPRPGEGKLLPLEIMDFDPSKSGTFQRQPLRDGEHYAARHPCRFPFGETPFHEALESVRIGVDLADETEEIGKNGKTEKRPTKQTRTSKAHLFDLPKVPEELDAELGHLIRCRVFNSESLHPAFRHANAFERSEDGAQSALAVSLNNRTSIRDNDRAKEVGKRKGRAWEVAESENVETDLGSETDSKRPNLSRGGNKGQRPEKRRKVGTA